MTRLIKNTADVDTPHEGDLAVNHEQFAMIPARFPLLSQQEGIAGVEFQHVSAAVHQRLEESAGGIA